MEFNINHYNALLSVFLENNHKFSPSEFLKLLEEKGIEPNLVTHRRILKAYCQRGDIKGAGSVLEKMTQLNFPLSDEDFNALIQCHSEMGEFQKANDILKVMQDRGIEPNGKTYVHILCGYAKHREIKKLMDLLEELCVNDKYLSSSDFLDIAYTLALNNQCEHIDKILEKLTDDYGKSRNTSLFIQRLLHQKMDSVALELFEKLEGKVRESDYIVARSKFILRHFALYREPKETLKMCLELEKKGWANASVGFVLHQIYLYKDENFLINFFRTMVSKNISTRTHYFWPLLIKMSEKGNSELLSVLSIIPASKLANCEYTTKKIVFPNYKFSEDWQQDNDVLQKAGLPQKWLSLCFIEKFLKEGKMEDIERVVSLFPVDLQRYNSLLHNFIEYVEAHPEEIDRFVNILYYLAHDFKLKYNQDTQDAEESLPESSPKNFFDAVVINFIKTVKDEKVFEQVLQKMLEKKFWISSKSVSAISQSPKSSKLGDLAKKLSDPGLQLEYDNNLLKLKTQNSRTSKRVSDFKHFKEEDEVNVETLEEELKEDGHFFKALHSVRNMIRIKRYEDALKLVEVLSENKDELSAASKSRLYFLVIKDLFSQDQYDWAEKAFYVGVDSGLLSLNDYVLFINNFFHRGESSLAVEKYCKHLEKTRNTSKCVEFLTCVASSGSEEDLRQIMSVMINVLGKNLSMTFLVIAFLESGNISKAKKLLETKRFKFIEQNFNYHCNIKAKRGTSEDLEKLLKVVKDLDYFDRIPLYKLLIKKYAEEENIEKVKKLWLLLEEDDISDYSFLEKLRELMDDPSVGRLKDIANSIQENEGMRRELKRVAS